MQEEVLLKYLYNPETDSFESLEPTLRDRFVLGGRVNFDKGSPFPITDEVLKQIDDLIKNTNLNLKEIGKKINYGTEKRSLTIDTPVMEAYIEKYGKPSDARLQTRGVPLSPEKGIGKKIVTAYDKQIKNFGKPNISQIVREVYGPGVKDFDSARAQVRSVLGDFRDYKGKANIPIDKKDLTAEQIKTKARVKKLKLIDNETIRKFMAGPEGSGLQYHHSDATKTSPVTLRNVIYVPSDVNNYIQKYEGSITQRKKEIEKLIKNKPDGYKKQIDIKLKQISNTIAKANIDLDKAGYSAFKNIIEVDTVDPFGKKIKIGGNTALKIGSDLAVEIGLDPDKPLKQYTSEEKIKLVKAKEALLDVSKRNIPDLSKVKPELDLKPIPRGSNIKAKITEFRNTAQNVVNKIPFKGLRMVPGAAAAAIDYGVFAGLLGTSVDEAIIGASGWLTKKPELGRALGFAAQRYSEGKINFNEFKELALPVLKEIAKEQLPESKLPPVAEEINDKMGEGTIKIADEVPEPESAKRKRMFDDFNERFGDTNEMEISDIDNPFMAAMGGRVGFSDGSPNPEVTAQVKELLSGLNNTEVMDNVLKNNAPSLEESMFGTKEESNLLQRLNQTVDPRAFPYYAAQLTKGLALAPEFAARFTLAAPYALAGLAQGKRGVGAEFVENIDPKVTQKQVIERFGLQKILDDMDQDITGSQRSVGEILKMGGESLGPATGLGYFAFAGKAANKVRKELQKYAGTAEAAKELEKSIEEKAASLQMTRREFNTLLVGGGVMGLVKALGLDKIFPAAKSVAQKAAPEIMTTGGTPKYFFDFVNLIKTKGDDVTDKAATLERQKVYNYEGYQLTEDISTGKISINKDTEGGASYYIGDGEYDTVEGIIRKEEIVYDPPETILDDAGKPKRVPDIYEENTLKPDYDGGDGDVEAGLESIEDILDLLSKGGKKYNLDELDQMGINPQGLGEDFLKKILRNPEEIKLLDAKETFKDTINKVKYKIEKAGGGIIKLAGDNSGPPPKSGPTPHGLPYVAKNVRPIKERK